LSGQELGVEVLREIICDGKKIVLAKGDITRASCDAVVNPANSLMIMGGGVAGALRRAAGEEVEAEARRRAPVPVGKAISTSAGKLQPRIRYIIHAPTMERPAMRTTESKVKKATEAALEEAKRLRVSCVAFPAMGAGVGGLSAADSLEAMLEALDEFWSKSDTPSQVVFIAYSDADAKQFLRVIDRVKMKTCKQTGSSESPV
jgi:O-acetyl-ADP-ribose deacetylase (regulator of RNase III)